MDSSLRDLLMVCGTTEDPTNYTHITSYDTRKRWTVKNEKKEQFWKDYCSLIADRTDIESARFCLAERPAETMPVIGSLVLKFHSDDHEDDEPYGDDFLASLCAIYQKVIFDNFKITDEQTEFIAVVLESAKHWLENDPATGEKLLVYEVRIQFPYARIDTGLQNRLIRPRVIQLLHKHNVLGQLSKTPIGGWDQILDASAIDHPIMMYGCSETPTKPKLNLKFIWSWLSEEMINHGSVPESLNLDSVFIPTNHKDVQDRLVDENVFLDHELEHWLPMFLSLGHWEQITLPKTEDDGKFSAQQTKQFQQTPIINMGGVWRHSSIDEKQLDLCEQLIRLINPDRFYYEVSWLDIGKALHHADNGGQDGMLSWIRYSEKAVDGSDIPSFMITKTSIKNTCRCLYLTFGSNSITMDTLGWYARLDAPDKYMEWHKNWTLNAMTKSMSMTHTDIAVAVYRTYWLDYAYDPQSDKFYKFVNHRWNLDHKGLDVKKMLSSDFVRRFEIIQSSLAEQIRTMPTDDENSRNTGQMALTKIANVIKNLKSVPFKSNILTELKEQPFKKDNFTKLLDSNPNLLGLANGVIEVANKKAIFRAGKPEDYISMKSETVYLEDLTWESDIVKDCMKWLQQVFPDPKLLHHFLKFAASCLKGRNSDKIFPIFTGEGNNSKSMIVKLFEKTFGNYCVKFDVANVSTRNNNPSGPSPQLARSKATRLAFMDEPDDDIPLHKGTIKRWVGGDSFYTRMLNENGGDIEVTFKLILTCNKVPLIPKDKAVENRVRLFPYLSTWSVDAPASPEEQDRLHIYPMDELFENQIPTHAMGFVWILTQYYPYYAIEGLKNQPEIVTKTTEEYWRENDIYAQFAGDCVIEVIRDGLKDNSARVTLNQIYDEFKNWHKNSFPALKIPTRPIVKSELISRWGNLAGKYWFGIKIIDDDEVINIKGKDKDVKPVLLGETVNLATKKRENPVLPEDNMISEKSTKKAKIDAAEGIVEF